MDRRIELQMGLIMKVETRCKTRVSAGKYRVGNIDIDTVDDLYKTRSKNRVIVCNTQQCKESS